MKMAIAIVTCLLFAPISKAEVVPFNVFLSSTEQAGAPATFMIPAGKIFLLEAFSPLVTFPNDQPQNTRFRISYRADNMLLTVIADYTVSDTYANGQIVWLPQPFRLKGGDTLRIPDNAIYNQFQYFGLMIDPEDLYAQAIPSEIEGLDVVGGRLHADARFASPRPRITHVETSTDLKQFTRDGGAEEIAGQSRNRATFAVDAAEDIQKFLRLRTIARP